MKIISRKYAIRTDDNVLHEKGAPFEVSDKIAKDLIKRNLAEKVKDVKEDDEDEETDDTGKEDARSGSARENGSDMGDAGGDKSDEEAPPAGEVKKDENQNATPVIPGVTTTSGKGHKK
ncbi:MAG: hypothetical protein LBQ97_02590 [Fusobacteriaceae bacterium]|jgi:hypothetical protein|nr:hypothetical protein [Fusobacteriaceae bacterium]